METLIVLYDPQCELCRRARTWVWEQPKWVPIMFVPAGSAKARRRYPELDVSETLVKVTAIDNRGNVWTGSNAWITILWALRNYRHWSLQLAKPRYRSLAKRVIDTISRNRKAPWMASVLMPGVRPAPVPTAQALSSSDSCTTCGTKASPQ